MSVVMGNSVIDALQEAGIIQDEVVRVVIDARLNTPVSLFVQRYGGPGITDVILGAGLEDIAVIHDESVIGAEELETIPMNEMPPDMQPQDIRGSDTSGGQLLHSGDD